MSARPTATKITAAGLLVVGVLVSVLIGVLVGVSHAASLGTVTSRSLLNADQVGTVSTPSVIGCDNFTGTTSASMASRAASVAASCANRVWTAHVGTWTIQSGKAAPDATASAVVTENTATIDSTAQSTLTSLNTAGRSGGLVLSHDGVSTYLAAVLIAGTPNRAELRIVVAGAPTVLTTATPTITATNSLRFSRSAGTITITLNGTLLISTTLSASDVTSLGSGARAGLFGGNSNVRFDDFLVTNP